MIKKGEVKFGDVYWADFDQRVGFEFQGRRPALVIQSNHQLSKSNLVTVMPLTSNIKNRLFDDIEIKCNPTNNLYRSSIIKVYDIISLDYSRFIKKVGRADQAVLNKVKEYLKRHFDIK